MNWRDFADWAKRKPAALKLADRLGRGRGTFRVLDNLRRPPSSKHKPDLSSWNRHELAAAWIGHATILLRIGHMNVLTDPVMGNRIGVDLGLWTGGPMRVSLPALSIHQLPKLDLILISHAHFDHLDRPTLRRLPKRVPVITAPSTQDLIRDMGFNDITEIRWGEKHSLRDLTITALKAEHWGARTFYDKHRGYNAYLLESPRHKVLYGGDTAYHEYFRDLGKINLAIVGIGAYDPYIAAHASPEQAWTMANHAHAEAVLPMHHSTFRLSYEPMGEPIERMLNIAGGESDRVVIREVGQQWAA